MQDHSAALDYDCMTRVGRTLDEMCDAPGGLVALLDLVKHLDAKSALRRSLDPEDEFAYWGTPEAESHLLADIYDLLALLHRDFQQAHSKKGRKVKGPKPHRRPGMKDDSGRRIGRDAIPIAQFDSWWSSKERQKGGDAHGQGN